MPKNTDEPDLEPVDPPEDGTEDDPPEWEGDK